MDGGQDYGGKRKDDRERERGKDWGEGNEEGERGWGEQSRSVGLIFG